MSQVYEIAPDDVEFDYESDVIAGPWTPSAFKVTDAIGEVSGVSLAQTDFQTTEVTMARGTTTGWLSWRIFPDQATLAPGQGGAFPYP